MKKSMLKTVTVITLLCLLIAGNQLESVYAETDVSVREIEEDCINWETNSNDYDIWPEKVQVYLTSTENGYMRVQPDVNDDGLAVFYYDREFNITDVKTTAPERGMEGIFFAGFYESGSNYFCAFGQRNDDDSDDVEVVRVVKYDKDWNRLGSCGIFGAGISVPFEAGACRFAMAGNKLYLYMSRLMYKSSDGFKHQTSIAFEINTDTMTENERPDWYASHSFNQFVLSCGDDIYFADHGDGYPRGIRLVRQRKTKSVSAEIMSFPGEEGENYTGASLGAVEASDTHVLLAGNAVYKGGFTEDVFNDYDAARNVFLATVDRKTFEVSLTWLTDIAGSSTGATTPHMVKTDDNSFMILWSEGKNVRYMLVDGTGTPTSGIYSLKGSLSDCRPIVNDGKVIWYTCSEWIESFYTVSVSDPADSSVTKNKYIGNVEHVDHTVSGNVYRVTSAENRTALFQWAKNARSAVVPSTVTIRGNKYKVTEVGSGAFGARRIQTVTIGANVKKINAYAFKSSRAGKVVIRTKLLKAKTVKNSLKGSRVRTIQVKVGSKKLNRTYVKKYKKIFTRKNAGRKVTVKS